MIDNKNFTRILASSGITIRQLAERTGISVSALTSYRKGTRDIPSERLVVLSDALDCSADYLLGRTDIPDVDAWAAQRNRIEREVIEKKLKGTKVSDLALTAGSKRMAEAVSRAPALAVFPYNLIEVAGNVGRYGTNEGMSELFRFYDEVVKVPLSKDQETGLSQALNSLKPEERSVLLARYRDLKAINDIADDLRQSIDAVRHLEAHALRKLRHPSRWKLIALGYEGCGVNSRDRQTNERKEQLKKKEADLDAASHMLSVKEGQLMQRAASLDMTVDMIRQCDNTDIDDTSLSTRTRNCLLRCGAHTVGQLLDHIVETGYNWDKIRNFGALGKKEVNDLVKKVTGKDIDQIVGQTEADKEKYIGC